MKRWRRGAEAVAVLLVLYFVGAYLASHWREIRSYPWEIAPGPLLAATGLAALSLALFAGLWTGILRAMGERIGLREALPVWFVSNLARYIPGKFWHISGMVYLARRRGIRAVHAVGANFLLQLLVVSIGALLLVSTLPGEVAALGGPRAEGAALLIAAGLVAFYFSPLFDMAYARGVRLLRQPAPPTRLSIAQKLLFGCGTAVTWLAYGASFWLFLVGVAGFTPPLRAAVGISVAGYIGGFLAFFTPAGLGVREGLYALLLEPFLPASVALAVALLARVWLTLIEVALAGLTTALARGPKVPLPVTADAPVRSDG